MSTSEFNTINAWRSLKMHSGDLFTLKKPLVINHSIIPQEKLLIFVGEAYSCYDANTRFDFFDPFEGRSLSYFINDDESFDIDDFIPTEMQSLDQIIYIELEFHGDKVGALKINGNITPKPLEYEFMPYRGPGHYELSEALRLKSPQFCNALLARYTYTIEISSLSTHTLKIESVSKTSLA